MTLLQLTYFVSLAENLHYTRTAEMLHISQPSLSYAIGELEKDLGAALFVKNKNGVALSQYGAQYYPYAKKALEALSAGRSIVSAMASYAGTVVRWGYFHSISASLVPTLIRELNDIPESANIRFQFTEDTVRRLYEGLHKGELDLCFTCHPEDWAVSVPIARQPLLLSVAADHPLAGRSSVALADFADDDQILLTQGSDLRLQVEELFRNAGAVPKVAYETRECNAALQYVGLGFGVAILPPVPMMEQKNIVTLPIRTETGEELSRKIFLSYHKTRPTPPAVRYVIEYILDRMAADE